MSRRRRSATSRKVLVSDQAGRSNVLAELERMGITGRQERSAARRGSLEEVKETRGAGLCL